MTNQKKTPKGQPVHGWLALDKPVGISSAKAVAIVMRVLNAAKAGHGGTLDPLASGILPIALGEATKTVAYVMSASKAYCFSVKWGAQTSTDDNEGAIILRSDHLPSEAAIKAILPQFTGVIEQIPPVYSAVKVAGKRAYALARKAEARKAEARKAEASEVGASQEEEQLPELAPRTIEILDLKLLAARADEADFSVACGKGAYIRALARDMGRALGSAGYVTALRRTRVGKFDESQAISLDFLEKVSDSVAALQYVMPVLSALDDISALAITCEEAKRLRHGQKIDRTGYLQADETAVAVLEGQPVAIIRETDAGLVPVRVLNI